MYDTFNNHEFAVLKIDKLGAAPPFPLKASMQLPRASSKWLMWAPSFTPLPLFWVWLEGGKGRGTEGQCTHFTVVALLLENTCSIAWVKI